MYAERLQVGDVSGVKIESTDVAAIQEGTTRGAHLRDECVTRAVVRQVWTRAHGERRLGAICAPSDERVAGRIDGDALTPVQ